LCKKKKKGIIQIFLKNKKNLTLSHPPPFFSFKMMEHFSCVSSSFDFLGPPQPEEKKNSSWKKIKISKK
jgi:hypothetical protein